MAKGYWLVSMTITDPALYAEYQKFVGPFLTANGGRFVVRGGQQRMVEGEAHPRHVVVEFESYAKACAVYDSAEYQIGMQSRLAASTDTFVIVEGFEG